MSKAKTGFDTALAEKLEQLEYYSHGDHVEVEIASVDHTVEGVADVTFSPPIGEDFTIEMDVPVNPGVETVFMKLLRETGRNFSTAPDIVGDRVPAKYTDSGWEIQYTQPELSTRERAAKIKDSMFSLDGLKSIYSLMLLAGFFLYYPLASPFLFAYELAYGSPDGEVEMPLGAMVMAYFVGTAIWVLGMATFTEVAHQLGYQFPIEVTYVL